MNSRFFLTVFITLIFHLGFSQNIIKNGTFKGKPKRTKSFKKSSSRLLNKKGESCGYCGKTPDQFDNCNESPQN